MTESTSSEIDYGYANMDDSGGRQHFAGSSPLGTQRARRRRRRSSAAFHSSLRQSLRRSSLRQSLIMKEMELPSSTTTATTAGPAIGAAEEVPQQPPEALYHYYASWMEALKYFFSMALLLFSLVLVMGVIFTRQTSATIAEDDGMSLPPILICFVFWSLIGWLAIMEGGQGALVGLQPIEQDLYADSHPLSLKITTLAYKGDNMERFIVGRQFLVVLVVFAINILASSVANASLWDNMSQIVADIFLGSGQLALILITLILGQLVAQVNAADCMLDFINNHVMLVTTHLALGIETLGLLHCTYLVQMLFSNNETTKSSSDEPAPRSALESLFFWLRVFMSLSLLGFAFAVTLSALFHGQTTTWEGVPNFVAVVLLFALMGLVGMMEGMQIALFAVINLPEEQLRQHHVAYGNCRIVFAGENMQAFLIGRQICVTICTFIVARITTINVDTDGDETIFGISPGLQRFVNTGLLGAVITTIAASLAWRIIAQSFPIPFLSNPLISVIIRLCLFLETSGICSAAWVLARFVKAIMKYELDAVYFDAAEPTHGSEPVTERDEDIDRLFFRSSITTLSSKALDSISMPLRVD